MHAPYGTRYANPRPKNMSTTPKTAQSAATSKYESIIATLSILGIACYLVLRYALDIGHEVYTLAVNAALTSAIASLYQGQFSFILALVCEKSPFKVQSKACS
jgi:hypothetical protein